MCHCHCYQCDNNRCNNRTTIELLNNKMTTIDKQRDRSDSPAIECNRIMTESEPEPPTPTIIKELNQSARGSVPEDEASLEFQWPPPAPVSSHTINLRLNMMNQDPKDLHTARAMIAELRSKVRFQTEHIIKWRKAYAIQVQQHYRYQKEKADQMNALTSQLLLLESRLKRKQKQIASLLTHRERTIQRQQKMIEELGICTDTNTNDSDSAIVLEDIEFEGLFGGVRRKNSAQYYNDYGCGSGITVIRSISDAIETNLNKYGGGGNRRNNCFLRRPDILETVYSVEEDPEPTSTDVAEKRDKFKNRSEKAAQNSSSSTEGHIDNNTNNTTLISREVEGKKPKTSDCTEYSIKIPSPSSLPLTRCGEEPKEDNCNGKTQVNTFNRIMLNHRSVTKPKDVKYKRINKAKSKSLEELRGRLKNLVERGTTIDSSSSNTAMSKCYGKGILPQATAHSFA